MKQLELKLTRQFHLEFKIRVGYIGLTGWSPFFTPIFERVYESTIEARDEKEAVATATSDIQFWWNVHYKAFRNPASLARHLKEINDKRRERAIQHGPLNLNSLNDINSLEIEVSDFRLYEMSSDLGDAMRENQELIRLLSRTSSIRNDQPQAA